MNHFFLYFQQVKFIGNQNTSTGNSSYELTNLPITIGIRNVLTSISDLVYPISSGGTDVDYYQVGINQVTDYSPFGVQLDGRTISGGIDGNDVRYGFNSMEKDDELKGRGNSYDFGARMLDPRLGRWLTTDPLASIYPSISPYTFVGNMPTIAIDPNGELIIFINGLWGGAGTVNAPHEGYWTGFEGQWIDRLKDHWKDKKTSYVDGSMGGQIMLPENITPLDRLKYGWNVGYQNAKSIIDNLDEGETIKFITNSMGAACQRGFSMGLQQYIQEQLVINTNTREETIDRINTIKNRLSGGLFPEDRQSLEEELKFKTEELSNLESEYQKLVNVRIEIVVDIEPQDPTARDPFAEKHYYVLSDKSDYNWFENNFLNIKPVKDAINASTKPDGSAVTTGHHSSFADPYDLPKP